jgi:hypothetical protein
VISWLFSPWLSPATFRAFLVLPPAKGVEVDHAPELSPMARTAPGQTAGAAPQEGDQPSQRVRPLCHAGGLERRPALPEASLLAKTARATIRDPSADRHDVASLVADIDHLGVEQGLRSHQPGLRLAAHFPTTQGTIHDTHELEQRRSVGLPSIRHRGSWLARATTCAISAAAVSCVRGPKSTQSSTSSPGREWATRYQFEPVSPYY